MRKGVKRSKGVKSIILVQYNKHDFKYKVLCL